MVDKTLREEIEERVSERANQLRKNRLASDREITEENRKKDGLRLEVVDFLEEFNRVQYPEVKPFLDRTPFVHLAVSGGHITIEDSSCYWGYQIALGDNPKIITTREWPSHPQLYRGADEVRGLGSGRIETKVDGCRHVLDVADRALVLADGDLEDALTAYQSEVHRNFGSALDSLVRAVVN